MLAKGEGRGPYSHKERVCRELDLRSSKVLERKRGRSIIYAPALPRCTACLAPPTPAKAGVLLLALSAVQATLISAAAVTPVPAAASLRTPPLPVAAHLTPSSFAEVIVALTAATPKGFRSDFLSLGTA